MKQVALGGMSCPASATRMISDTVTVPTRNATEAFWLSTLDSRPSTPSLPHTVLTGIEKIGERRK